MAAAVARFHPELLDEKERRGRAGWHVSVHHPRPADFNGTSSLGDASADSVDLARFADVVAEIAERLGAAGDPDPLDQRRAKARGLLADLHNGADLDELIAAVGERATPTDDAERRGDAPRRQPVRRPRQAVVHVHATLADLATGVASGIRSGKGSGTVEADGLGPAALGLVRQWLADTHVRLQPVIDLARHDGVDAHDPPFWMVELVRLRDRQCVFPWCGRDSRRCDLDHIDPYDPDGPPGQTRPDNLAPLCRRHHNGKTLGHWLYRRRDDGSYMWTDRYGRTYLVTDTGTLDVAGP